MPNLSFLGMALHCAIRTSYNSRQRKSRIRDGAISADLGFQGLSGSSKGIDVDHQVIEASTNRHNHVYEASRLLHTQPSPKMVNFSSKLLS